MLLFLAILDLADFPLAGHGYDVGGGGGTRGGPSEQEDGGGISAPWIIAFFVVALVALGVLVAADPSRARARLRRAAPKALIVLVIAAPLAAWAISSGDDERRLIVERWVGVGGAPELLISLGEDDLNTLETTRGQRTVRVECVDRDGAVVLDARQEWPFVKEPGFEYPHAHQAASRTNLQRADRCRILGARVSLEAQVEGALTR